MVVHLYQGGTSDNVGLEVNLHQVTKPRRLFKFLNSWLDLKGYPQLIVILRDTKLHWSIMKNDIMSIFSMAKTRHNI